MPLVDVLSPWPGRVAQLHVEVGADVVAGQEVVTIESMKIMSPRRLRGRRAGRRPHVELNGFVQERSPLLSIETF